MARRRRIQPEAEPPMPREFCPMVSWYDPAELMRSARDVFVSTLLGRHSDHRLLEALASIDEPKPFDCTLEPLPWTGGAFWLDYLSDTGDGFNPVYAMARCVSGDLQVKSPDGRQFQLNRGALLVLGGDEVYPTASRAEYQRRFVAPFRAAMPESPEPRPKMFAIPGNHDWYDSLVSFTRLFISRDRIGGWDAPQQRSYFALKLPYGWWLLGTDSQLDSDIDKPQVDFFRSVARGIDPSDRVILCNAEPHWIYAKKYAGLDPEYTENNLRFLEEEVLGRKIAVYLAGDLHHYRRHECVDGTQKITSGGGGAFLHPTHGADVRVLEEKDKRGKVLRRFELKAAFPDEATSRRLAWRNLLLPYLNPTFGFLTAALYAMTAWASKAPIGRIDDLGSAVYVSLLMAIQDPFRAFWSVNTVLLFWLFTDTHSRPYRIIMGFLHGAAHLLTTFLLGWKALAFTEGWLGIQEPLLQTVTMVLLVGIAGWSIGPIIVGIYLLISINVFSRHDNEAFSSLAIQDYKQFLRMKIDEDGTLTIYPVGIRRVPRRWKPRTAGGAGPVLEPDDSRSTAPELIEAPVILAARRP